MAVDFVELEWRGRPVRVEYEWVGLPRSAGRPLLVFLHEGLGSRSMWREFPQALCGAGGFAGLVYSRPGYGRSTPRAADERWGPDFMHRQAHEVLPALRQALKAEQPVWLFGHSDGGSIGLLHAARFPDAVAGAVLLAPHVFVEEVSVQSIRRTRQAFLDTDLQRRLARHHDDVDSAFWGWNDIWLDPAFRTWSIEAEIEAIRCPLLAVQGVDDEYGTLQQIHRIGQRVAHAHLLELSDCGHSPHRDQPERATAATVAFIGRQSPALATPAPAPGPGTARAARA
jgi:pimeloyl-ACP methyl ester carboxylesterase